MADVICAACGCTIPSGFVMCEADWRKVPLEQKKEIYHQQARQRQGHADASGLLDGAIEAATASVQ